ncbi:MAG: methyltransferase domain-containing protein [Desulfobacteraceae bacterium]|nr:MAG: methyltransferase domain-containing protein [Desulfobacteraceae bacterium]
MVEIPSIDSWLVDVRKHVLESAPDMLPILDVYAGEAQFGRRYIAADLARLPERATVLEVGAGSLLLSCQLVREGFEVTALEPVEGGFSHFERLRELVLETAETLGCVPCLLNQRAEELSIIDSFDYAFSINAMEHVSDVEGVIANIVASLRTTANYHFTCPNYLFPYEPHFNMPTLFSKTVTEKVFGEKIYNSSVVTDPSGVWKSLNWINVPQIKKIVNHLPGLSVNFNRMFLVSTMERVRSDVGFASRRSMWVRLVIDVLISLRLHYLAGFLPASLQPIIDCTLTRSEH